MRSTTGHTFGGYASAPWNSAGGYITAEGCFLFLVENPHGDAPTCFECKKQMSAMLGKSDNGPTFGAGQDLRIHCKTSLLASFTQFPSSYTDTLGRGTATFTGSRDFTLEEYEVWATT